MNTFPLYVTAADLVSAQSKVNFAQAAVEGSRLNHRPDATPRTDAVLADRLAQAQAAPNDMNLLLELAQDYMELADATRWDYLDKAVAHLQTLHQTFPNDPVVRMLLGRAGAARALNETPSTMTRLRWAREGYKHMDAAVKQDPDNAFLRLLRAESGLLSHPVLRRANALKEDARILLALLNQEDVSTLPNLLQGRLHLFAGNYIDKTRKDRTAGAAHWTRAQLLAAGSPIAAEAAQRLQGRFQSIGYTGD